jgi:hypothetical protein
MTGLRACKQSSASRWEPRNLRQQTKDGNEEMGCIEDAEGMDIDDNSQEQEQEGTQSTSAEELLSKMVAGVRSCLPYFRTLDSIWPPAHQREDNILTSCSGTKAPYGEQEECTRVLRSHFQECRRLHTYPFR